MHPYDECNDSCISKHLHKQTIFTCHVCIFLRVTCQMRALIRRSQNHSGLTHQWPLRFLCHSSHTCSMSCIMTFRYLTVSYIRHVYDISIPDSFIYYMTFQYLTVSCIPATGYVSRYDTGHLLIVADIFCGTCR